MSMDNGTWVNKQLHRGWWCEWVVGENKKLVIKDIVIVISHIWVKKGDDMRERKRNEKAENVNPRGPFVCALFIASVIVAKQWKDDDAQIQWQAWGWEDTQKFM